MRVSKPCIKDMLKEVLKKHKQAEHTRVNVKVKTPNAKEIAMSRDAEREKRLKVSRYYLYTLDQSNVS